MGCCGTKQEPNPVGSTAASSVEIHDSSYLPVCPGLKLASLPERLQLLHAPDGECRLLPVLLGQFRPCNLAFVFCRSRGHVDARGVPRLRGRALATIVA